MFSYLDLKGRLGVVNKKNNFLRDALDMLQNKYRWKKDF